jgi:hypothetical protein
MSDTNPTGAPAPEPAAVAAPVAAPPETRAPQPESRSPFVVLKPISTPERVCGSGTLVSLTVRQAAEHATLIRPATALDVSRWGRAVPEL